MIRESADFADFHGFRGALYEKSALICDVPKVRIRGLYSVIDPCSVSLNEALSLNVSSMTWCLPPMSLGLMFLMITSPSFVPFKRALTSCFIFFTVGAPSDFV